MGWKAIKEHYRIVHLVLVDDGMICIGSPYIHDLMTITLTGDLVKLPDRTINKDLQRYQDEMLADPDRLRQLAQAADTFDASIPVFTFEGAEILEKRCEALHWPNVTHDGAMMYENTFFADRASAVAAAKRNCAASIKFRRRDIASLRTQLDNATARLDQLGEDARKLGLDIEEIDLD